VIDIVESADPRRGVGSDLSPLVRWVFASWVGSSDRSA
jgi:hypothetical protein